MTWYHYMTNYFKNKILKVQDPFASGYPICRILCGIISARLNIAWQAVI